MPRTLPLLLLLLALGSPAHAGSDRGHVAVSLAVLPACAARVGAPREHGRSPAELTCTVPLPGAGTRREQAPTYTVRTYRSATGTVVSYDF